MEDILRSLFISTEPPVWDETSRLPASDNTGQSKQKKAASTIIGSAGQRKRKRTLYSKWQQIELESVFEVIPYPDIGTREQLARIIRLPESKVQVWFQNRRARKNKSSKLDKTLYLRGSSPPSPHPYLSAAPPMHCYRPLNSNPFSPRQPGPYGHEGQQVPSIQPAGNSFTLQTYSPASLQHTAEMVYQGISRRQELQWQDITCNGISPEYRYETTLYDTQTMEMEHCTNTSYDPPHWDLFPYDNGPQTSLGNISEVIYSAALVTNVWGV
ncbi:homeobox protein SEBOX [Gastrophryne carolinensis]